MLGFLYRSVGILSFGVGLPAHVESDFVESVGATDQLAVNGLVFLDLLIFGLEVGFPAEFVQASFPAIFPFVVRVGVAFEVSHAFVDSLFKKDAAKYGRKIPDAIE